MISENKIHEGIDLREGMDYSNSKFALISSILN